MHRARSIKLQAMLAVLLLALSATFAQKMPTPKPLSVAPDGLSIVESDDQLRLVPLGQDFYYHGKKLKNDINLVLPSPAASAMASPSPYKNKYDKDGLPIVETQEDFNTIPYGSMFHYEDRMLIRTPQMRFVPPHSTPTPPTVTNQAQFDAVPPGGYYYENGKLYSKAGLAPLGLHTPAPAPANTGTAGQAGSGGWAAGIAVVAFIGLMLRRALKKAQANPYGAHFEFRGEARQAPPPPRPDPPREERSPPRDEPVRVTSMRQAYSILGLTAERPTMAEIKTAFRARMAENHPDKVSHMAAEFRQLAERRSKEINAAMDYIKANFGGAPA